MRLFFKLMRRIYYVLCVLLNKIYNIALLNSQNVNIPKGWIINGRLYINNQGKIKIGNNFRANSGKLKNPIGGDTVLRLIVKNNAIIQIGDNVGISNSTIVCWSEVVVEDHVFIGGGCKIWDTDFHSIDYQERIQNGDNNVQTFPVIIKRNAFIGGGSIILKGVTIGENSIIGAGSVVTKIIPDNQIWAGNPAVFIKNIV